MCLSEQDILLTSNEVCSYCSYLQTIRFVIVYIISVKSVLEELSLILLCQLLNIQCFIHHSRLERKKRDFNSVEKRMDSVVNVAVEEICSGIEDGVTLAALWVKLQGSSTLSSTNLHLNRTVKRAIWRNLLRIPGLRFEPQPSSSELEDAEKLNIKIFPQLSLVDNFVGLYESQSLQHAQTRVLHLLANARGNGITQAQLAKLLHINANNFHYVLRSLECQGLIVKRSAIEKKKQISSLGESKNFPCVTTHLVYLRRYAKQLACHQRFEFEITKFNSPEEEEEDADGATFQTDVHLKDYSPQLKAICDKLAKANGKVHFHSVLFKVTFQTN